MTLPYAGQAFHIDDAIFWDFARKNLEDPFSQHLDDYHLMGEDFGLWRDSHPPVDSLYLALMMYLTGSDAERPPHIGFIVFPLIAGISMYFLARRFVRHALLATLLMLATPAVMVMSHNLMADLPMMAFWLAATVLYVYGVDRDDLRLLMLAAAAVTVAAFTGYQALAMLVLLPAYPLFTGRLSWRNSLPLLLPVAVYALFTFYNLAAYGELQRLSHSRGTSLSAHHVLDRIEGMLLQIGGASVFPLMVVAVFSLRKWRALLAAAALAVAATLAVYHYQAAHLTGLSAVLYAIFLTAALVLLAVIVVETCRQLARAVRHQSVDTDFLFLVLWIAVMLTGTIAILPHATAKYTLTFLAPVILIIFRELESAPLSESWIRAAAVAAVVLTFLTGTAVAVADYQLAGSYRDFVRDLPGRYQTAGSVWFIGEWGFRHYMEAQGAKYLSSTNEGVAEGDIIVSPAVADWPLADSVTSRMRLVETVEADSAFPVRVMGTEASAGFYGTHWGMLPFALTRAPVEQFEVFVVGPPPIS